ncbi:MAG: DUF4160 domain-containing protein [Deltaproteobacteria bacterium]|nr:DUF4160 domain-containing protein [Deltaproteobacteria bacterium]
MPTIFRRYGYRFHFYSNENNEPPHVHVTGKGGEMKIWMPELIVEFAYRVTPSEQKRVMKVVKENVKFFMEKWHGFAAKKK